MAASVVVLVAPRDFITSEEGLLDVVIRGVVQVLGRGSIATCRHSASDVREEECEDKCSEIDHCGRVVESHRRGIESEKDPNER